MQGKDHAEPSCPVGWVGTVAGLVALPLLPPALWLQVASPQPLFRVEKAWDVTETMVPTGTRTPPGTGTASGTSTAPHGGVLSQFLWEHPGTNQGCCLPWELYHWGPWAPPWNKCIPPLLYTPGHAQLLPFTEIWGCKWEFCKGGSCKCGCGAVHSGVPQAGSPILVHGATKILLGPQVLCSGTKLFPRLRFYLDCLILEFGEMEVAALPFPSGQ